MAHSLVQTLQACYDEPLLDVLAPTWSLPLVRRMPGVRQAIALPLGHGEFRWSVRRRLGHKLRVHAYDQAIVIPRSFKAALVPFHARIARRTGFLGESRYLLLNDIRKPDKSGLDGTARRYVALGLPHDAPMPDDVPMPLLRVKPANRALLLQQYGLQENGFIALMPGAEYGPAKQWPASHFRQLAQQMIHRGLQVVVLGSAKERELGESIVSGLGSAAQNMCGATELVDAIDLLSACRTAVSNDSGLMHVAAAVSAPLVAIYGSSSPRLTPPLSKNAVVMSLNLSCSPCFKRTCPLGHTDCLNRLLPSTVSEAMESLAR